MEKETSKKDMDDLLILMTSHMTLSSDSIEGSRLFLMNIHIGIGNAIDSFILN